MGLEPESGGARAVDLRLLALGLPLGLWGIGHIVGSTGGALFQQDF